LISHTLLFQQPSIPARVAATGSRCVQSA